MRLNLITARFAVPGSAGYARMSGYPLNPQNSQRERKKKQKRKRKATATIFAKEDISTLHKRGHFYFALTQIKIKFDKLTEIGHISFVVSKR